MCLAVPAEVIAVDEHDMATCRVGDSDTTIQASLMLLEDKPALGDYIIIHAGFALRIMDFKEAQETLQILRDMIETMGGQIPDSPDF